MFLYSDTIVMIIHQHTVTGDMWTEVLKTVSQTQKNESECERRRAIEQRAGSCFIVDGASRIADEESMRSWTEMAISKRIP